MFFFNSSCFFELNDSISLAEAMLLVVVLALLRRLALI